MSEDNKPLLPPSVVPPARPVWGHAQTTTICRGKRRVQCRCGKQSGPVDEEGARDWIIEHRKSYGLVERKPGRRSQ